MGRMNWIDLSEDTDKWPAPVVFAVIIIWIPYNVGHSSLTDKSLSSHGGLCCNE